MRVRYSFSSRHTRTIDNKNNHRVAYPKLAREVIRISDIILEVLDARYIEETRNVDMEEHVKELGKKLVYVINKVDLVKISEVKDKLEELNLKPYVLFSCTRKMGKAKLADLIKIEIKRMKVKFFKAHVGIIGYPNTGKSSLINFLVGRGVAGRSPERGHTRGIQHVRFNKDILILDTPGVIVESETFAGSERALQKHAKSGVRNYDKVKNPDLVVANLMKENPGKLEKYYKIKAEGDSEILLDEIGKIYNFLLKGKLTDVDRAARFVLKAWQEGKIK